MDEKGGEEDEEEREMVLRVPHHLLREGAGDEDQLCAGTVCPSCSLKNVSGSIKQTL